MTEAKFERCSVYFKHFRKYFRFYFLEDKLKTGVDFPVETNFLLNLHSPVHEGLCNIQADNHYHVLAQSLGDNITRPGVNLKVICFPAYIQPLFKIDFSGSVSRIFSPILSSIRQDVLRKVTSFVKK